MNQELYDSIYLSLTELIDTETEIQRDFVSQISALATSGVQEYISELEEANLHLRETIKRLTEKSSS